MSPSDLAPGGSTAGHPALTARERRGWLCYDFSNSAVVGVIVSGFLPLLVQDAALGLEWEFPVMAEGLWRARGLRAVRPAARVW